VGLATPAIETVPIAASSLCLPIFARRRAVPGGAELFAIDRDQRALDETILTVRNQGGRIEGIVADCVNVESVVAAFADIPTVDVLVNCVGSNAGRRASEFWNSSPDTWQ
jgi:NAD(P)-dependent dehydrogenase (short-subunit alcohol dehydrogenase family)